MSSWLGICLGSGKTKSRLCDLRELCDFPGSRFSYLIKGLGLGKGFSTGVGRVIFFRREHVTKSGDIFSFYHLVERGANGIKWVETTDTAKYPTIYRIFSTTKNYLAGCGSVFGLFKSKLHLFT